jgi:hypothetical protein
MICSAQEETLMGKILVKILFCKSRRKKLKRVPGRAPNYKKKQLLIFIPW